MGEQESHEAPSGGSKRWLALKLALALLVAAYAATGASGRIQGPADSCIYLTLARQTAAGEPYAFDGRPHVKYPPVYPAMLAAVIVTVGEDYLAMNLLGAALAGVAFLAAWSLAERLSGSRLLGALTAFCFAGTMLFFEYSTLVLSDMPYTALSLVALLAAVRWIRQDRLWSAAGAACIAAVAAAYLTRLVGAALLPAVGAGLLIAPERGRRGRAALKKLAVFALLVAVPLGAWHARNRLVAAEAGHSYAPDLARTFTGADESYADEPRVEVGRVLARTVVHRPLGNLRMLGENMAHRVTPAFGGFWLALGLFALASAAFSVLRGYNVAAGYCLCYGAILALAARPLDRYVLPVLPLGFYFLLVGLRGIGAWVHERGWGRWAFRLLAAGAIGAAVAIALHRSAAPVALGLSATGLAVLGAAVMAGVGFIYFQSGGPRRRELTLRRGWVGVAVALLVWNMSMLTLARARHGYAPRRLEEEYIVAARWLRDNSEEDAVVMSRWEWPHTLAGRRWRHFPFTKDHERIWRLARQAGARFLVVNETHPEAKAQFLEPVVEAHREELTLRKRAGKLFLFELAPEAAGGGGEDG